MQKPTLVFEDEQAKSHWMAKRVFKRSGHDVGEFPAVVVSEGGVLAKLAAKGSHHVVVFGERALWELLQSRDILRWHGRQTEVSTTGGVLTLHPCLDPQMLLARRQDDAEDGGRKKRGIRAPSRFTGTVVNVIKRAVAGERHPKVATNYLEDPSPMRFRAWVDEFYREADVDTTILSSDIETPYKLAEDDEEDYDEDTRKREKTIIRISFCYRVGHAVSVPFLPEYVSEIKRLLAWTGLHCGWNCIGFDRPILAHNGGHIGGLLLDGMDAWHLYQTDLDKGLEFVTGQYTDIPPWKHLSDTLPARYSCIDADAALRNILAILVDLERVGLKDRFFREMEIMNILDEAGQRGNAIDDAFRLELKQEFEQELYVLLWQAQELVAEKFLRRKYYKRLPKGSDPEEWGMVELPSTVSMCSQCGKLRVSIAHKCQDGHPWEKTKTVVVTPQYYKKNGLVGVHTLEELQTWLSHSGFNPCSHDQMKKYMRAHKHPVGTNHKTKKDSADVKHLQKLVKKYGTKHPIYQHTLKIRLLQKALSTYVNGLEPDEHGRIHTTYVNSPSTWRLGSRNINVQNLGKRKTNPYATRARKIIIPSTDRVLINADSSSIEAYFVGWYMQDEKYMREARLGIHAGLCCEWLKWQPTPENRERAKTEHKDLYEQLKTVVHGTNFGMGPYLMHMNDPEKFPTLADAKRLQEFLFKQLPMLPIWHHQLRVFAQKNGYLDNPWGLRHYFYDVFTYQYDEDTGKLEFGDDGLPKVKLGKDGKRVIAFKPQSSAGLFMRDNIYLLGQTEAREWMPAVVSIHDGYCLDVPLHKMDTAKQILIDTLTRPITEMGGIRVGCEVEVGYKNFLDMEKLETIVVEV